VLVLAACSPGGPGLPGASPSTKGDLQQMLQISRQFSQCVRDHGHANFPDALIDVDEVVYPDMPGLDIKAIVTEAEQIPECKAILDQLQSLRGPTAAPLSADDLRKLREFAACIRSNGVSEWPDPKADGTFPINGTPLENEGKSERLLSALDACKSVYDKRIATS
jgi:hypothetical protein